MKPHIKRYNKHWAVFVYSRIVFVSKEWREILRVLEQLRVL